MRIAILQDDFPPAAKGGAGIVVHALASALRERGHTVVVICATQEKARAGKEVLGGFEVYRIYSNYHERWRAWRSLYNPRPVAEVKKILLDFKPEVVHAHNVHYHLSYFALVVAKRSGARVLLTCHDVMSFHYAKLNGLLSPKDTAIPARFDYWVSPLGQLRQFRLRYNPFRNVVIRFILKKYVDRILAVSHALADALTQNKITGVAVVHNGIDVDAWREPSEAIDVFKKRYALGEQSILFGGRLSRVKGAVQIIKALTILAEHVPDAQLLVIGEKDAYAQNMIQLAHTLGVADRILFTGWISGHALRQAYHAATVVAVPSICFDSFPTMILEAMACAKPVIATCLGGAREAVVDGQTGYIVNPYNELMLAEKITQLLNDKDKRSRFGRAGQERVNREFPLARQVELLEKQYTSLL